MIGFFQAWPPLTVRKGKKGLTMALAGFMEAFFPKQGGLLDGFTKASFSDPTTSLTRPAVPVLFVAWPEQRQTTVFVEPVVSAGLTKN